MEKQNAVKPFGMSDKIGYMFGDFANDFTFILASMFLMKFYTNVMGISGAAVGTLFLVARIVDAFTDVAMGRIVDTVKPAKDGKFRPWIRRMCGPVALASFLMYQSGLAGVSLGVKMVYMYVTYLLWGSVFYTSINIPYGSMASAITSEPSERTALSTFRGIGATLAGLVIGIVVPFFVYDSDNNMVGSRMTIIAGVFAVCAVVFYIICYKCTTERVKIEKSSDEAQVSLVQAFGEVFKSRALLGIIGAAIFLLLSQLLIQSMNQYLYPDYFQNAKMVSLWSTLQSLSSLLVSLFTVQISKKFGKKESAAAGVAMTGIVYLALYFMHTDNAMLFTLVSAAGFIGVNFFNMVIWANIIDVIDYQEVRTHHREDGTIYAVYSFARKLGQALAGGLGGYVITAVGYDVTAKVQSGEVLDGIYMASTLLPAIFLFGVVIMLVFVYPLNKKKVEENAAELKRRREGK
ncbi:MAG: glycoside-pentoside-hexuronide (GPH):cation symporter [Eubacteriales bacterium]|nr:glycoside-pentoside-hexuronide (GPH):cation symporter [Eubacteriales bacterium]